MWVLQSEGAALNGGYSIGVAMLESHVGGAAACRHCDVWGLQFVDIEVCGSLDVLR